MPPVAVLGLVVGFSGNLLDRCFPCLKIHRGFPKCRFVPRQPLIFSSAVAGRNLLPTLPEQSAEGGCWQCTHFPAHPEKLGVLAEMVPYPRLHVRHSARQICWHNFGFAIQSVANPPRFVFRVAVYFAQRRKKSPQRGVQISRFAWFDHRICALIDVSRIRRKYGTSDGGSI